MPIRPRPTRTKRAADGPGEPWRLFAVAAPGLEPLIHDELRRLGVNGRITAGGVAFSGGPAPLYAANLHLRTASRILVRLGEFAAAAFHELERRSRRIPWEIAIRPGDAVEVRATSRKSRLYHSDAVAERVLAAIDRRVGGILPAPSSRATARACPERSEGDRSEPTPVPRVARGGGGSVSVDEGGGATEAQLVVIRIDHDRVTVSIDSSGALLHQRGYRLDVARAPLRETLAAALVLAAGWDPRTPLVDPMCGSGTIAIEAALIARRIAPGLARSFAFERWPNFEASTWRSLRDAARQDIQPNVPAPILASDRDDGAVEATRSNASRAGVLDDLTIDRRPLSAAEPPPMPIEAREAPRPAGAESPDRPAAAGWLVTNPPYGVRVGDRAPLRDLYARLGQLARARFAGWMLALLTAEPALERQLALDLSVRVRTSNGGIPVRMVVGRIPT